MTVLERVQILRADEQTRSLRLDEPTTHDRWQIRLRPGSVRARAPIEHSKRCLAGDCDRKPWRTSSYCQRHADLVRRGVPVDGYSLLTKAEASRMSSGLRFGYGRGPATAGRKGAR